jgi:large subunit ribosomal protein L35
MPSSPGPVPPAPGQNIENHELTTAPTSNPIQPPIPHPHNPNLEKPFQKALAGLRKASTLSAPMSKNAGIAKTRKAVSKRFKLTASGKVLRRKKGKRHLLQNKNRKRKRNLGKVALVAEVDAPAIKANMPFA